MFQGGITAVAIRGAGAGISPYKDAGVYRMDFSAVSEPLGFRCVWRPDYNQSQ